jgi:hypothetical protein
MVVWLDPDLSRGELREPETAQVAIQAALTRISCCRPAYQRCREPVPVGKSRSDAATLHIGGPVLLPRSALPKAGHHPHSRIRSVPFAIARHDARPSW